MNLIWSRINFGHLVWPVTWSFCVVFYSSKWLFGFYSKAVLLCFFVCCCSNGFVTLHVQLMTIPIQNFPFDTFDYIKLFIRCFAEHSIQNKSGKVAAAWWLFLLNAKLTLSSHFSQGKNNRSGLHWHLFQSFRLFPVFGQKPGWHDRVCCGPVVLMLLGCGSWSYLQRKWERSHHHHIIPTLELFHLFLEENQPSSQPNCYEYEYDYWRKKVDVMVMKTPAV